MQGRTFISYLFCSFFPHSPFVPLRQSKQLKPKASAERQAGADSEGKVKTPRNRDRLKSKGSEDKKAAQTKQKSDKSNLSLHLAQN